PYSKVFEDDGSLKWYPNDYYHVNPLINHHYQERLDKTTSIFASMYADIALPLGFSYRLSFQPRLEYEKDYNFWGRKQPWGAETDWVDMVDGTTAPSPLGWWII